MGFLQTQHEKHFSCHCRVLYSIFLVPVIIRYRFGWLLCVVVGVIGVGGDLMKKYTKQIVISIEMRKSCYYNKKKTML